MAECDNLREKITQYTPGSTQKKSTHGYQRVTLQLFGFMGHGKSSLINSCVCVGRDEDYQNLAGAGPAYGTVTIRRNEYELTKTLVIIDNRGFSQPTSEPILEVCGQLSSLRDIGEVKWDNILLTETLKQFPAKYSNRPADYIVPVLVYSAKVELIKDYVRFMEGLVTHIFSVTGIPPIAVVTNCTAGNKNEIERQLGDLGVMHRHFLENYTENDHQRSEERDKKILDFLNTCIDEAERGIKMSQNQDPQARFVTQAAEQIKQEADILREENKNLTTDNTKLTTESTKLTTEHTKLSTENTKLSTEVTKLSTEITKLSTEITKLSTEVTKLSTENNSLREQLVNSGKCTLS
ncbi:uncharacterized protein LOC142098620 [Mixophyes fleayi]|uniref:uncharacterized protein LOC142098620 n=1 Tax=Mixophyes fleayi TaxID=3061075 RepID=UPI003F4D958D